MNNQIDLITNILYIALAVLFMLLIILAFVYLNIKMSRKNKQAKKVVANKKASGDSTNNGASTGNVQVLNKMSVLNFMEFDTIDDNMIIEKNGKKFVMAIECQGINYDLMSAGEKDAVESGFIQFLNTLRTPIQLYIQTRAVNLEKSIQGYKNKVNEFETELEKLELEYKQMQDSGRYTKAQLDKQFYEVTRRRNLYEYGKDVIRNTESMSLNNNVLKKKYYIIISYFSEEANNEKLDKEEIKDMAFSELYTRAQSLVRAISVCGVVGRILDSYGLAELLYNAYNREEAETYGIDRAIKAGYDELYSTAPDVIEKKMKLLDEEISKKATDLAVREVEKVRYAKQNEYDNMQKNQSSLIYELAQALLEQNAAYIGEDVAQEAQQNLAQERQESMTEKTEEGGAEDVQQEEKKTRRGRKPKTVRE